MGLSNKSWKKSVKCRLLRRSECLCSGNKSDTKVKDGVWLNGWAVVDFAVHSVLRLAAKSLVLWLMHCADSIWWTTEAVLNENGERCEIERNPVDGEWLMEESRVSIDIVWGWSWDWNSRRLGDVWSEDVGRVWEHVTMKLRLMDWLVVEFLRKMELICVLSLTGCCVWWSSGWIWWCEYVENVLGWMCRWNLVEWTDVDVCWWIKINRWVWFDVCGFGCELILWMLIGSKA